MKKRLPVILLFFLSGLLLSGCLIGTAEPGEETPAKTTSAGTTLMSSYTSAATTVSTQSVTVTEAPESVPAVCTHGAYMISDGAYIYYCPPESDYDYQSHFGSDRSERDCFVSSLRRVAVTDALTDPLNNSVILVDQHCRWLCLHDGMIYFVDHYDNAICRIPCAGGDAETLCSAYDIGPASAGNEDEIKNLQFIDGYLYFFQFGVLKRIVPDVGAASVETVFNVFHDDGYFHAFCESTCLDPDQTIEPYAYEFCGGDIFLTIGCADPYQDGSCALVRIDPDDFSYETVSINTTPNLALCGDRLYYQKQGGVSEFGETMYDLMAVDAAGPTNTGVASDARTLFSDGEKVYYDGVSYSDLEPDDRLLFSYDETDGVQLLNTSSPVMYIDGVAGNVLWYENFADHIWMDTRGDASVAMATEYVRDDAEYGPGMSSLDLHATDLSACFRLIRTDGEEEFRVFLSPHESRTVTFPCGKYILKIAEGETWISDTEAFGPGGSYSTTDYFVFEADSSYYIGSGTRGDFRGDNADGFLN